MTTVGELIDVLGQFPKNLPVIIETEDIYNDVVAQLGEEEVVLRSLD